MSSVKIDIKKYYDLILENIEQNDIVLNLLSYKAIIKNLKRIKDEKFLIKIYKSLLSNLRKSDMQLFYTCVLLANKLFKMKINKLLGITVRCFKNNIHNE